MFRINAIEMVHWDFWQRIEVPLDAQIVTIIGPNGSGKTTLLDALRTLLALECSGRRDYKRYVRNNKAPFAWLRGVVENPRTGGLFPYPFWPIQSEHVTLFCRIKRQGGDWVRQYAIAADNVSLTPETEAQLEWLGVQEYRRRLEQAGLTAAIAKVLALEQGDTDKLCEYSPKHLLDLVFQVFGDKAVLDHYAEAKDEQKKVESELLELQRNLNALENEVEQADQRASRYLEWRRLNDELSRIESETLPRVRLEDQYVKINEQWQERKQLWQQWRNASTLAATRSAEHESLTSETVAAKQAMDTAQKAEDQAREAFAGISRKLEEIDEKLAERDSLSQLARELPDQARIAEEVGKLRQQLENARRQKTRLTQERKDWAEQLEALKLTGRIPLPHDVTRFRQQLDGEGITHDLVSELVEITDTRWQAAVEGLLRPNRYVVLLKRREDRLRAREAGQRARYRHFVSEDRDPVPMARPGSLLEAVRFSADVPSWVTDALNRVSKVDNVRDGEKVQGDWITPDGYFKERRGTRFIAPDAADFVLGAGTLKQRQRQLEDQIAAHLDEEHRLDKQITHLHRQLEPLQNLLDGVSAASQLALRSAEFNDAEAARPELQQQKSALGETLHTAWRIKETERDAYLAKERIQSEAWRAWQEALTVVQNTQRERRGKRFYLNELLQALRQMRSGMVADWLLAEARQQLRQQYPDVATVLAYRKAQQDLLDAGLLRGDWITDDTVLLRRDRLRQQYDERAELVNNLSIQLERAKRLTEDARAAYINKLKSTIRQYAKNIKGLGELAGIEVETETPHLENDDIVLNQAGLQVKFNFDQKGMMGMNDGEASGGQQVMKSLILLVGLMMNEERPSGFVFIDEPFAHLDIFNIDRVGAFLKATEAQYLITTPNTHNINIFEPSELTLTTRKKRPGEAWAPALLQTRRKQTTFDKRR
ncbi:AAA family ATPase [Leeia sp. TBRC 13508]|uniref:AAA family ATPase n=1 Tax=Leeia speluncae TaxID=2884804 RepID=A0ABS8D707_9NEIS|nr:AAA family ATPase [Leeia speluncae]MCB6183989.1 AAA family ATPase [Leeia speluncae]